MQLLAENCRNEIAGFVAVRGVGEGGFAGEAGAWSVFDEDVGHIEGVRHGLDAVGVEFRKLLDVAENLAELRGHRVQVGVRESQPGEKGDFLDVGTGEGHG